MSRKIDITGQVFGRLTVIREAGSDSRGQALWLCRCECGKEKTIKGTHIRSGMIRSCGCLMIEKSAKRIVEINTKHGMYNTHVYGVWNSMLQRCENRNHRAYALYGGRGIKVCERWHKFKAFYDDFGYGYKKGLSIDRIDVNGNYEPGNCRWSTSEEQAQNRRNTILIEGVSLKKFCRDNHISYDMIIQRVEKGMSIKDAVSLPSMRR